MFDKDQKNLQSLLMERVLTPPPSDGDRWEREQFPPEQPEQIDELDRYKRGENLLISATNHPAGVNSAEVRAHIANIVTAGALLEVKKYLQHVKNTIHPKEDIDEYKKRQAAEELLTTYSEFNEEEETTGDKPEFKKNTPSSWERYKEQLMWGSDMDPKQLKNLCPEERKKRLDKFFKPTHHA